MNHRNRGRLDITLNGPWRLYQRVPLAGWQMLGTVQRGMSIGALAKSPAGLYAQLNAGNVHLLNSRKVTACLNPAKTHANDYGLKNDTC